MLALLLDLGWKSALTAGLGLLANHLLRHRAPGERVAMLRATLVALLLLPLLVLAAPAFELAVLPALETAPTAVAGADAGRIDMVAVTASAASQFDWVSIFYWAVAGLLLLRLLIGVFTLWRWTRNAAPVGEVRWASALRAARLRRPVRLLVSPRVVAPMSWGLSPAWVLIGPATERRAEQAEAVIAHELAHIRRFDWPVLMVAQLATFCFWFNPLVWLLARELARQTELAADGEAIHHVARADYAQTLLSLAGGAAHPAACGMSITYSTLGRRICCVLDTNAARPASKLVCAALLVGMPLAAGPLAATQLVRAAPVFPQAAVAVETTLAPEVQAEPPALDPAPRIIAAPVTQRARSYRAVPKPALRAVAAVTPLGPTQPDRVVEDAQRHAGHAPPPPRPPVPAPGSQAAAWKDAISDSRREAENRIRNVGMGRAQVAVRTAKADDRDEAGAMADAAKGLRVKAQELERVAADGSVAKPIRDAHARAAGSLRNQADRLDMEARRKLFGG